MIKEPLKNKKRYFEYWGNKKQLKEPHKFNAFYEEDVKSAVEWLKGELKPYEKHQLFDFVFEKIDEAFPDLSTLAEQKEHNYHKKKGSR